MKQKIILLGLFLSMMFGAVSCTDDSFLDETQTSDLTKDVIFSDSTYTVGFLNHIYEDCGFDVYPNRFDGGIWNPGEGGLQTACDEAEFKITSHNTDGVQFVTGTVNAVSISETAWKTCYNQIRAVNVFLENVDKCPMTDNARTRYKAEARFLRAWYYFILLRHYGGVPLLGDVVYDNEDVDNINMKRNSFAEVVDYIVSECNAAASDLPTRTVATAFGRASGGTCMGLISRTLLYAASPLYNGSPITTDATLAPLVGYTDTDQERWKAAAEAARRLIATGGWQVFVYHADDNGNPYPGWGYWAQFEGSDYTTLNSWEDRVYTSGALCGSIFMQIRAMGNTKEQMFDPVSCGGNGNGGYPTHDLAEAYPMLDGAVPGSGKYTYDRMNPDKNRDPRFALSIIWNGSTRRSGGDENHVVSTYQGFGSTNDAIYQGTRTGYYWRKQSHVATAANHFNGCPQLYTLMRYEEILLNYAEAVNEYYGPDYTETLGAETLSPYSVLRLLRERAGIEAGEDGTYGIPNGLSRDKMREAIRAERRIELAFEGHRFFDVRRWKIAEQTENGYTHGFEVTRTLDGSLSSKVVNTRQHVFRPAMYFWPIPYNEVVRSEDLLQNPYYE